MSFELLRRRALSSLRDARIDLNNGDCDLTLLHVRQFAQPHSKYLINLYLCLFYIEYKKIDDFPKAHSVMRLLWDLI